VQNVIRGDQFVDEVQVALVPHLLKPALSKESVK
jgi:hypothetical protein